MDALLMMGFFGVIAGFVTARWSTPVAAFVGVLLLARFAGHGLVEPRLPWSHAVVPAVAFGAVCAAGVTLRWGLERLILDVVLERDSDPGESN